MKNRYLNSLLSSALSITPMILIVMIMSWIPGINGAKLVPLEGIDYIMLGIGLVILVVGLALFQIGAANGLTKVGEYMGASLSAQKQLFIVIVFSLALGALITCAEPSILIVSKQVKLSDNELLNKILLVGSIAVGVGAFVVIGVLRIIFQKSLKVWFLFFYFITFMIICLLALDPDKAKYLPFVFDSGGITTGSATVPFILALGAGVATVRGGKNASSDSFGLVGIASVGPIIAMATLILIKSNFPPYEYIEASRFSDTGLLAPFLDAMFPGNGGLGSMFEVIIALAPIIAIFFIYEMIYIKLPKNKVIGLFVGFTFAFIGLTLFLSAVGAVMKPMGDRVGRALGQQDNWIIILIAFIIGLVTILCEPAVHVLTTQMVDISSGHIKKITVLLTLSLGVGIAIALSAIRALYGFSILYYLIPGYTISIALMFICPDIYTAMAFDSGGTASGPMSTSFVLPMIIGITVVINGGNADKVYADAFGVVALIAMTPVIAIQILGVVQTGKQAYARYIMRKGIMDIDDAQIIHF